MGKLVPILFVILGAAAGFFGVYYGMPALRPDYVEGLHARLDSIRALSDTAGVSKRSMDGLVHPATDETIIDSLNRLRAQVEELERRSAEIDASRAQLAGTIDSLTASGGEAAEIASTLSILEDKELARVVGELDDAVLRSLYVTASRKNQARLLKAMPPERAGHLIRSLFDDRKQ